MDQENIYHYVEETLRGGFPPTDHPEQVIHHDINSNPDIFPYHRKDRDYDTSYIYRQRSADRGADAVPPTQGSIPSQSYMAFESARQTSLPYTLYGGNRKPIASSDSRLKIQNGRGTVSQAYRPNSQIRLNTLNAPKPNVQQVNHTSRAQYSESTLSRMNRDFQKFAQNNGFKNESSTLSNHLDTPVPEYPYVSADQQPTDEIELPPNDSNPPRDEANIDAQPDHRVNLEKNIFGEQRLGGYRYPFVYKDSPFMQLPQMNLIQNPKVRYLHVDSRTRNRERYPNPNNYVYPLIASAIEPNAVGVEYKNIYEIRLTNAVIPNINNPLDLPYIILVIEELSGMFDGVTPACRKAFAKLLFCECTADGKYLRLDNGDDDGLKRIFYPAPLASLGKLTIRWLKPDGTLFNWGTDTTPPVNINEDLQNSFTLQIVTMIPDAETAIGHRQPN